MDNPSLILQAVDHHLNHEVQLVIYGRAALCLGFDKSPPEAAKTQDVDAIEAANAKLASKGLYITHLFSEREVFLREQWQKNLVPIKRLDLRWLRLFRPATLDLILSKMMRGTDPQDMEDAGFMIRHDRISEAKLTHAFAEMKPIALAELRDAFAKAKPTILKLARELPPT